MNDYYVGEIECCYCNVCGTTINVHTFVDNDGLCTKCIDNFITECEECGREISYNKLWDQDAECEYCEEY